MSFAVISIGSNIEAEKNVLAAKKLMSKEFRILAESEILTTKPVGFSLQPDFLNSAVKVETSLDLKMIKERLKDIETTLGRVRTENKNGPRTIDLDLTIYEGRVVNEDFYKYDFVRKTVLQVINEDEIINDIDEKIIEKSFRDIIEKGLHISLKDPNFVDTPARVARSYKEIFSGLSTREKELEKIFSACFPSEYKGIVAEKRITVFSMCPHHFLPIRYNVSVGYIPSKCSIGLSKLARAVELLAKKPVLQETLTQNIVDLLDKHMSPLGVICTIEGTHYCMQMRGAKQKDVITTTSAVKGIFLTKPEMEIKFYELIKDK